MMRTVRICALAVALTLALSGCQLMKRISEGAYRNAVADGTVAELAAHGVRMNRRPDCTTPATGNDAVVRIHCTGRTATGAKVVVTGGAVEADTAHPRESYVITVDGRAPLRKRCLGRGC
ncbi:hypothetical protein [Actinomadura rugatobispora]|uniref:DUF4333 domain-containing protein n=1 Tax=Actinomadura rugatobispora TaxID=1994 RepID=A0ABW1AJX8_9ACTN|nr:hypothetical protein GCM10010200_031120 [Actinomadura rugatobispora]